MSKIASTTTAQQELVRSFVTIVEMLGDRGVDNSALAQMSGDDVISAAAGRLVFYIDDPVSGFRIIYDMSSKFRLPNIRKMLELPSASSPSASSPSASSTATAEDGGGAGDGAGEEGRGAGEEGRDGGRGGGGGRGEGGIRSFLVVVREWPSTTAESAIRELGLHVQLLSLRSLQFNISHHKNQPRFQVVRDEEEIAQILAHFMVKSRLHLPIIYDKDPMAQYLGLRHGELVRITRDSPTAGVSVGYRCCCTRPQ